jgi:hypothetical protein
VVTKNVQKQDFFVLLEAQRVEHLLIDVINASPHPSITNRYYSQLLAAQRLMRAQIEVELYRFAIEQDGLCLLTGVSNLHKLLAGRILTNDVEDDEEDLSDEEPDSPAQLSD